MSDLTARLRELAAYLSTEDIPEIALISQAADAIERLERQRDKALTNHVVLSAPMRTSECIASHDHYTDGAGQKWQLECMEERSYCFCCSGSTYVLYPCPTVQALTDTEASETEPPSPPQIP